MFFAPSFGDLGGVRQKKGAGNAPEKPIEINARRLSARTQP